MVATLDIWELLWKYYLNNLPFHLLVSLTSPSFDNVQVVSNLFHVPPYLCLSWLAPIRFLSLCWLSLMLIDTHVLHFPFVVVLVLGLIYTHVRVAFSSLAIAC